MIVNRVGILPLGKIMGAVYACLGLIPACFFFLFFTVAAAAGQGNANFHVAGGVLAGTMALIFMPILYGIVGFIGGVLTATVYNIFASLIGGIELELAPQFGQPPAPGSVVPR